jgi:ribonuclease Z
MGVRAMEDAVRQEPYPGDPQTPGKPAWGAEADGAEGLLPSGVTAYTGAEVSSSTSGREDDGYGESGGGGGRRRQSAKSDPAGGGFDTKPSQDYVKEYTSPGGAKWSTSEPVPKRGPGSGRRLAASAAMLSPDELDHYLEEEPSGAKSGPGPQPFPHASKGERTSGEVSGEGRTHTSDMEVCFLGTASCLPSLTRGVSSVALRLVGKRGAGSSTWIFDAGEGTQIQMQKSWCRPSTIDKIFITHLHGDHSFGVVGLMCLIGQNRDEPLEIYGPAGLRALLRVTLQLTGSRMLPPYRVIELHDVPFLHQRYVREPTSACEGMYAPMDRRFKETDEGEDIYPDADGAWRCCQTDTGITVIATAMQHTMPCVGYCVSEPKGEDRLLVELVQDIVERNKEGLRQVYGRSYKKVFKDIKALQPGQHLDMPSGEVIYADDVLVPARPGRKVVILGDTCDASSMVPFAAGADLVVHEATNAWIPGLDDKSPYAVQKDTIAHGHSTPDMAGDFARAVDAKRFVSCVREHARVRVQGGKDSDGQKVARNSGKLSADV